MAFDSDKAIDASCKIAVTKSLLDSGRLLAKSWLQKPVVGGTASDVVKGSPVKSAGTRSVENVVGAAAAEMLRKATVVQGLADGATSLITLNPVAAAGLAMSAADVAESMTASGFDSHNNVASNFAASALAAATSGSATAAGLIEATISTAVHVAETRSKNALLREVHLPERKLILPQTPSHNSLLYTYTPPSARSASEAKEVNA